MSVPISEFTLSRSEPRFENIEGVDACRWPRATPS
jgi:hypothetical protein